MLAIGEYARAQHPGFLVIPQNAPELGRRSDYLAAVDGIGKEGIYFGYDEQNLATEDSVTDDLEDAHGVWTGVGKLELTVDYAISADNIADAYARATGHGFTPTVTDVDLAGPPSPRPVSNPQRGIPAWVIGPRRTSLASLFRRPFQSYRLPRKRVDTA